MPTRKHERETTEEWARRLAKVVYQRLQELSKNQ